MDKRTFGFTIVELSVVAVIIAILAVLGTVSYKAVMQTAVEAGLTTDIKSAENILNNYLEEYGDYPASLNEDFCPIDTNAVVVIEYCLKPSADNSYSSYVVDNSAQPPTYSITALNPNGTSFVGGTN